QRVPADLLYPVKDAEAIGRLWQRQKGRLFEDVKIIPLLDEKATRAGILKELANLEKLPPDDRVILYLSGHDFARRHPKSNLSDQVTESFCTWDFECRRSDETALTAARLHEALARVNARKLVLLDTCRAGGAATVHADAIRDIRGLAPEDV